MPEKLIPGWPERTKEIKKPDGKKEIILPEPVDMNKFSRGELARQASMNQLAEEAKIKPISQQFSAGGEKISPDSRDDTRRKIHRRQDEIREGRGQQRKFREKQKEIGAENYGKIWER